MNVLFHHRDIPALTSRMLIKSSPIRRTGERGFCLGGKPLFTETSPVHRLANRTPAFSLTTLALDGAAGVLGRQAVRSASQPALPADPTTAPESGSPTSGNPTRPAAHNRATPLENDSPAASADRAPAGYQCPAS